MSLGQDFADLVNDHNARVEARFRRTASLFDMTTSDAMLAASVASDEIRPTYMIAAHRLLQAAEVAVEDGSASPELVEAVRSLRAVYPTPG